MATKQIHTDLSMQGGAKVTGLPTPSGTTDAATKAYVDTGDTAAKLFAALAMR